MIKTVAKGAYKELKSKKIKEKEKRWCPGEDSQAKSQKIPMSLIFIKK